MDYSKTINYFKSEYKKIANKDRAINEKKYLKSPFKFYGVSMWDSRKISKKYFKELGDMSKKDMWNLVDLFWNSNYHELRRTGMHLISYYQNKLDIDDINNVEKLLMTSTNWDQIDEISAHFVGEILTKNWNEGSIYLIKWSADKNFWMRRSSMLSMLIIIRDKNTDIKLYEKSRDLFFKISVGMLDESIFSDEEYTTEIMPKKMGLFFIRKCIGWVLRDMSKYHPDDVIKYVNTNKEMMSGLSYKEATRKLSDEDKKKLI
ncbi:DNA alkylation repair protein [archaeon]|jgi:3-methyladenine DNA glycosylase AlkD|nr:DNA alkylation repair protein [archaeon]MBT4648176.1 DNA alkylation repair protein [archaeon]MBT6822406.1 DNA alkylation repair protein [archaeon]MBT7391875.1 DNA alkylation repair protein [archaeon]